MDGGVGLGLSLYSKAPALNWLRFSMNDFCGIEGNVDGIGFNAGTLSDRPMYSLFADNFPVPAIASPLFSDSDYRHIQPYSICHSGCSW